MKAAYLSAPFLFFSSFAVSGNCAALNPQVAVDIAHVSKTYGATLPIAEIRGKKRLDGLVAFINALPANWETPWYGPPVGKVYFQFFVNEKPVGNFYIGPNFFGRDAGGFLSQSASKQQVDELSEIVGIDLWSYIHEKGP